MTKLIPILSVTVYMNTFDKMYYILIIRGKNKFFPLLQHIREDFGEIHPRPGTTSIIILHIF